MSLWSSILDVLKTMSTIAGSVITYLFITVPTLGGAVIAFLGVLLGQYLTHLYTRRRENKKLLREKAEDLIHTLCQIQHSVFIWHDGLIRDARLSNESRAVDAVRDIEQFGRQRLPEPTEYRAVGHAILLDHQRADTIQRLYFPSIERSYEAHVDALIPLLAWLEGHRLRQEEDAEHWLAQFLAETTEHWPPLHDAYRTVHTETIEAIARIVLPYRKPSRALSRIWHHR